MEYKSYVLILTIEEKLNFKNKPTKYEISYYYNNVYADEVHYI